MLRLTRRPRALMSTAAAALAACTPGPARPGVEPAPGPSLAAFGTDAELRRYLTELAEAARRAERASGDAGVEAEGAVYAAAPAGAPAPAPAMARARVAEAAAPTADAGSVTNVQHAGVDEGDIVKRHGRHLVVLRRGRLFTVALGKSVGEASGGATGAGERAAANGRGPRPVAAVDAFGPGVDPSDTWFDEMLVHGDQVLVVGYSYARGGTEVGRFRIDAEGGLTHLDTYQLRSADYYSSRNYATRLVGDRLVFYTPLPLRRVGRRGDVDPLEALPALRRWRPDGTGSSDSTFERIAPATRVYRPARPLDPETAAWNAALHTVTVCDLANGGFDCQATAVVGPSSEVFYVSPGAVYVWTARAHQETGGGFLDTLFGRTPADSAAPNGAPNPAPAVVYRLPLDGGAPQALGATGSPVDQFSFLEGDDGHLSVLLGDQARGAWMWNAERPAGHVALLRVPLASFGDGAADAPPSAYRALPTPGNQELQNRFVGRHLLYGTVAGGWGWGRRGGATLTVVPLDGGPVAELPLPHGVDRIEAMGAQAVVVGTTGRDLAFSGVRLEGGAPAIVQRYTLPGAAQGALRSHGFFYRADGPDAGVIGLPVREAGRPGYAHLREGSAAVRFVRNAGGAFTPLGALTASAEGVVDDGCRASCVDWYGNARPLFLDGRVFALLGYELVEGREQGGQLDEVARVNLAPRRAVAGR